jgi:peptidoglycan hydrolase-like protein with peptidoglycan-binding domain
MKERKYIVWAAVFVGIIMCIPFFASADIVPCQAGDRFNVLTGAACDPQGSPSIDPTLIKYSTCPGLQVNMRLGMNDRVSQGQVSILQRYLNQTGYLTQAPTGYYGKYTFEAVKAYQADKGITASGYTGPLTRNYINGVMCTQNQIPTVRQQKPIINQYGLGPTAADIGSEVAIFGKNLSNSTVVRFQGGKESPSVRTYGGDRIIAIVPEGAQSGTIAVCNGDLCTSTQESFTVTNPIPQGASIQLLSPLGGETITLGSSFLVSYSVNNWGGSHVLVYLEQYNPASGKTTPNQGVLIAETSSQQAVNVTLTASQIGTMQPGSTYKIKVCNKYNCSISDTSDSYITLASSPYPQVSVDLKVNGSDTPAPVKYGSAFTVSWTSKNAGYCSGSGHYVLTQSGEMWTNFVNLPAQGSMTLIARHANFGYHSPLQLTIQCGSIGAYISEGRDEISVPVYQ